MVGWNVVVPTGWFIEIINDKFTLLFFMCKCNDVYMDFDGSYACGIYVSIMMDIFIFDDNNYLWLSKCFTYI